MTRCAESAAREPLAGTAPRARWWWLIEVPGSWGRDAVKECRIPAVRDLPTDDERRVILIRRPGRHPATDHRAPLRVWIAGAMPGDPPARLSIAEDPEQIRDWPIEGPADAAPRPDAPVIAVCTNASRDMCCGLDGRSLVADLADIPGVWECSHLGGHRFAPTALHVPSGLVYGRLTDSVARRVIASGPGADTAAWMRGRSSLPPPAQAAEIQLLGRGLQPDPSRARVALAEDTAVVTFDGVPTMRLRRVDGMERLDKCGGVPQVAASWRIVEGD